MSYKRQTFIDGEVLEAEHLNHIEVGLEAASNALEQVSEDLSDLDFNSIAYASSNVVLDEGSVRLIEGTEATVEADDSSEYFDAEYIVVDKDTYKLDKETMLSLQSKSLTGNGSVAWKDWDTIIQGWKDSEDATMLSSKLKVRYADDPVYMSMKLPSEANFSTDYIIRPAMRGSDGNYVTINNIGAIMPVDYTKLPDEIVICIGNLSVYTLSREKNAKWKLHDRVSIPAGQAMYYLPWSSNNDKSVSISNNKMSIYDDYIRFTLTRDDFAPNATDAPNSLAKTLHFWGNHNPLDLANNLAVITFFEVWTETPEAVGQLYTASGCDQKSADGNSIAQNFWGRNVLLQTKKTVITGHNISDTLYDELRDTPNDPRVVYWNYGSVDLCDYEIKELLEKEIEIIDTRLTNATTKVDACYSTLSAVTSTGININPGVYERGWFAEGTGAENSSYNNYAFRSKDYIRVDGGKTIAAYWEAHAWNTNNTGKSAAIVQYDANKNIIIVNDKGRLDLSPYRNGYVFNLEENTVYIRIAYNTWHTDITDVSLDDVKIAIYYEEDAVKSFTEYELKVDSFFVDGSKMVLIAPSGAQFSLSISDDGTLSTHWLNDGATS